MHSETGHTLTINKISAHLANKATELESMSLPANHIATGDMLSGLWLDLSEELSEPKSLVKQGDVNVLTYGNFSCITGQAKSRKTFLISAITGAFLGDDEFLGFDGMTDSGNVLYFDTEQSRPHVMKVIRRIHRIAGFDDHINSNRLRVLCLRELSPPERITAIYSAFEQVRPDLCVIDGVADLMADTNSNTEAVTIATMLLQLTSKYDCHIMTVIHTNPGGDKARGHIGSEIIRKAETVMHVAKDGHTSKVTAAYCRDMEFQEFAFIINEKGQPELTEILCKPSKNAKLKTLFTEIIPAMKSITHTELKQKVMEKADVQEKQARRKINDALNEEILMKNDAGQYYLKPTTTSDETLLF